MTRAVLLATLLLACGESADTVPSDAGLRPAPLTATAVTCMQEGGMPGNCLGLDIVESSIAMAAGTAHASVVSVVSFTDHLTAVALSSDGQIRLADPGCSPTACDYTTSPLNLPRDVTFQCLATDDAVHTAMLTVFGTEGPIDTDSVPITCLADTGSPVMTVSPTNLMASSSVGVPSPPQPLVVANNGTGPLTFTVLLNGPEWSTSQCVAPATCTVAMGTSMTLGMVYTPSTHGVTATFLTVDGGVAGMPTVSLQGTGTGGKLELPDLSPPYEIDFGTIGRNQQAMQSITLHNSGNASVMVTFAPPGPPFGTSASAIDLAPGMSYTFAATCQSATPMATATGAIMIGSTAYASDTNRVDLKCTIANTQLQVTPTTFDFMEVRKDSARPSIPITIRNPGPVATSLTHVRLGNAPGALALTPFATGSLAVGESVTGTMSLATAEDQDLAGAQLEVGVDGEQLAYPVVGKVVTPAAEVRPAQLDLGTACIGTTASAPVMMVNTGTARLTMERPTMEATFTPMYQSPTSYPAPLLAGTSATVAVSPAQQAIGAVDGSMVWAVDAPGSPFAIPIHLEYIDAGTAVSPGRLDFGRLDLGTVSSRSTITLQNCNRTPITVTIDGVLSQRGAVTAWDLQPRYDQRTLAPQDRMTVTTAFAPRRPGSYHGQIKVDVDGELRLVDLLGEGVGASGDHTSFYACATGDAARGWPLALAVAVALRRRRRRGR